jgi:hypothetical protein
MWAVKDILPLGRRSEGGVGQAALKEKEGGWA